MNYHRRPGRSRWPLFLIPLLVLASLAGDAVQPKVLKPDAVLPERPLDVDLGERAYDLSEEQGNAKEVVAFYAKEVGLLNDPVQQARIETIGHRIITAAQAVGPTQVRLDRKDGEKPEADPPPTYTFRVLDTEEINAFSAWGGNIYITRGMLEFCQSDDEIAGILGHEVAHTTYHHLRDQVRKIQRYNTQEILALIAAAFMGVNVGHVAAMVQYVHLALLNGHSVEAEAQADYAGCFYAYRAGYDPVGMITTFERLHRLYQSRPHVKDLGAFQTHPWSDQRAESLEEQIRALGLPIDRRKVTNAMTAAVREVPETDEQAAHAELLLGDTPLARLATLDDEQTAADRAADAALAINKALNLGLRARDLRLVHQDDHWQIKAIVKLKTLDLVSLHEADAALSSTPTEEYAKLVHRRFLARCREEELNRGAL